MTPRPECRRMVTMMGVVAILGLTAIIVGLVMAPAHAWASLLVGNMMVLSWAMGAALFIALNHVFGAGWAVLFRRVPEAMTAYIPVGALILLATFAGGGRYLYPWLSPEHVSNDPHLRHKLALLNPTSYVLITVVTLGIWWGYSVVMRLKSRAQDTDGRIEHTQYSRRLASVFLVLSGLALIPASMVWLMSLEPSWTSTMYPGYVYASLLTGGCAAMALLVAELGRRGILAELRDGHIYELTRLVGAACTLWVYIWFSQYMLIYYTNIPEESIYFAVRKNGPFGWLFLANVVLNWLIPMLMIINDRARRSATVLRRMCGTVLLGRWLDTVLLVVPAAEVPFHMTWYEVLIPLALLPCFLFVFSRAFFEAKPIPERDPYLVESRNLVA